MTQRLVENLVNIGPKMAQYLFELGITTEDQLRDKGVVETFKALKQRHPSVMNRMALYALYGALTDQNCLYLPEESKEWLEEQLQSAV